MVGPRKRLFALVAAFALLALVAAGCGGGGDDATEAAQTDTVETTPALSKEELLAQGDAICAEVNAAVGTVGSTSTDSGGQARQAADLYAGMAERLEGLGAPSDDSAGYPEFISAAQALAQAESDLALAAERGEDLAGAEATAAAALSSFQSAADGFGFEQCGEEPRALQPRPDGEGGGEPGSTGGAAVEAEEPAPAPPVEEAPETGGGAAEEGSPGGGAAAGGGTGGGGSGGGSSSGGIGPG